MLASVTIPASSVAHEHDIGLHHVVPAEHHVVGSDEDLAGVVVLHVVGQETGQAEDDPPWLDKATGAAESSEPTPDRQDGG